MASYLLDTNVLLRLVDRRAPEHDVCRRAVEQLRTHGEQLCVAPQVVVKFWVVATRPEKQNGFGWPVDEVGNRVEQLGRFFDLREQRPELFRRWFDLVRSATAAGKRAHDARLAAFMELHAIDFVLTLNRSDFLSLGVQAFDPQDVVS